MNRKNGAMPGAGQTFFEVTTYSSVTTVMAMGIMMTAPDVSVVEERESIDALLAVDIIFGRVRLSFN